MNIEELLKQARSLLDEANKALEEDDFDLAKEKREAAVVIQEKIKALKEQQDIADELDAATPKPQKSEPVLPPFEAADDDDDDDDGDNSLEKSFNILKYGELDPAVKAVTADLYGVDYLQKRTAQMYVFGKFLRTGRISAQEETLSQQIILIPDAISAAVKGGFSVAEIKATLQEGINDLGGFLVPEDFRLEIIKRLMGLAVVRSRARVVQTIRDAAEWPKVEGGDSQYTSAVRVTWVDELPASATVSETNPEYGMYRVPVHTVMARTDISQNMLEDTPFNMIQILAELFSEAMAIDEDNQFLTSTGGGKPRGILGKRGSGSNAFPEDGIDSVSSGNATALTADGLIDLVYGLHSQYRKNAVLVGARATHGAVRKLKDGNGDYLWAKGIAVGEPATLLDYPFLESESMPAIAANNYPIIFGDLKGYLLVDRVGMSIKRVEDTTTVGGNKVALFARRRLGGQVVEPWRFQGHKVSA